MTNSALKGRADDPRACRGVIRATFLTFPMVIFLTLALSPLSANVDNSGNVSFQRCEAYADVTPTEFGYQFLEAVAGEAGLSVNDTVATIAGLTASSTGLVIANSTGIVFGASGNAALNNLAEAADYPDWDTLSAEDQAAWVNRNNYDAAKFNSLLDAYGMQSDRERYYASSGGNFEFSQDVIDNIKRIGRIGSNWGNKIGVAFSDITSTLTNRGKVISWFPAGGNVSVFDATNVTNWPSAYPRQMYYSYPAGNEVSVTYDNGYRYRVYNMSTPVYAYIFFNTNSNSSCFTVFALDSFTCEIGFVMPQTRNTRTLLNAQRGTYKGNTFYYRQIANSTPNFITSSIPVNYTTSLTGFDVNIMGAILFGEGESIGETGAEEVPDYPQEEIQPDTVIYYPVEGVNPEITWPKYVEVQRPDNEYNPDNQTGKDEWKQETSQNVIPLQQIRFDKLFPFCLMTDVKDLTEKIEETITPGQQSDYLIIRIPMAYASNGEGGSSSEDIELDGTPLRDLLVMVRPFNQILLLFLMVFSLVMFWKSILTGD